MAGREGLFPLTPPFVDGDSKPRVITLLPTRSSMPFLSLGQDGCSCLRPQYAHVGKPDADTEGP